MSIKTDDGAGGGVATVGENATVAVAAEMMREDGIGSLIVTNTDGKMVGIITERDIIGRVVAASGDPATTVIKDVMTRDVARCDPGTPITEAQGIMAKHGIRHLPIVENDVAVGMISSRDVMTSQLTREQSMKTAAEDVAKLCTSLKSVSFEEVIGLITHEVPTIFGASRDVLCLPDTTSIGDPTLRIHRRRCPCPESCLRARGGKQEDCKASMFSLGEVPDTCAAFGAQSPAVTIPLDITALREEDRGGTANDSPSYFCMCDFEVEDEKARDLIQYKGELLRDILGTNLVNARLYEKYLRATRHLLTDTLTGVGTRRLFEDRLEAEVSRAERYRQEFCMAIVDVDHLKLINDGLGHPVGDKVLKEVGSCMNRNKRASDVAARYGGDEFVLLMPQTNLSGAITLLKRLQSELGDLSIIDRPVTISCGIVQRGASESVPPTELVRRADLALYHAKGQGRDCVACWADLPEELRAEHTADAQSAA